MSGLARREPWRRVLHLASGTLGLAAPLLPSRVAGFGFLGLVVLALLLEVARLRVSAARVFVERRLGDLFRPAERDRVSGATALTLGYALAWWIFPARAAALAIVVTAVADPAGAAAGSWFAPGADRKTWIGSGAVFGAAALVLFLWRVEPFTALLAAAATAVAERTPGRAVDNVAVPLAAGLVLTVLR